MKKYIYALLVVAVVFLMSWAQGFNFDERGSTLFITLYLAISLGGLAYVAGNINE